MTAPRPLSLRLLGRVLAALALVLGGVAAIGFANARAEPIVRRMTVRLPGWPRDATPVRLALLSDIHIGSPAADAGRLARVVAQVNRLRPDLVLIAGDFVAGRDPANGRAYADRLAAPLAGLRAPLGVVSVLGNHDHWTEPGHIAAVLRGAGETVLANDAVRRGPLVIVGIDDEFSGHADVAGALAAAERLAGARVVLTHTPDTTRIVPAVAGALLLAGHTHCGQVVLPLIGPVIDYSPKADRRLYDPRYRCGAVRDPGRLVVVTGGIGGSLPFRFGAPPDLWLLTLGP